ncbi:Gfo/Idh/MocA family protein [Bdellovibrio sp. NC01]|uniref:Gfo/Idh/MocA family protein n=1 Tax=Bdellovibrio sp. NC01 TaxID=2220073 RepID=UPI00115832FD|nr:Gfo/Idh/MocA family oxidoreductase [Bdellovibrio sp. NC01]QDK37507.1 oxidoreductase [Bdellovibrio sp. NC01]
MNFAIIGVGGYIAPRHLEAIKDLGHNLVAAYDHNDSVGIMDRYFPDCQFFTDFERFESYVDSLKGSNQQIDYVSICTPNYMHASHIKFALSHGAHAICEKPLVLHTKDIDDLLNYEKKYDRKVYTVLQLRVHDAILALKKKIDSEKKGNHKVDLVYITSRGQWYHESWKGDVKKSGGLSTNIGVHFFDMLTWIFGNPKEVKINKKSSSFESGELVLEKAHINWSLTIDRSHLPPEAVKSGKTTFRSIKIDGEEFEFSEGFTELHKRVYTDVLGGKGYGLSAARAAIEIVEMIREQ